MRKFLAILASTVVLIASVRAESPAEQRASTEIKAAGTTIVHLWAPWCSNCLAELKSGGWAQTIKEHPQVKFLFVSVWDNGDDGATMLKKYDIGGQPNVIVLADPGPRTGAKIRQFVGMPFSWIPTTWVFKGGELRYALNYGEMRFPVLVQFIQDVDSSWEH
jgi:thiol-disulfide isomerase/thioredoxin